MGKSDRLRRARFAAGFRYASEAARSLGVAPATYIHHENGTRDYGEEAARLYSRRFHVGMSWLLLGEPETEQEIERDNAEKKLLEGAEEEAAKHEASLSPEERAEAAKSRKSFQEMFENRLRDKQQEVLHALQMVPLVSPFSHDPVGLPTSVSHWERWVSLTKPVLHPILDHWAIPRHYLIAECGMTDSTAILFQIEGDVMAPTLRNGDLVLVDARGDVPEADGIYLLSDKTGPLQVRRIQRHLGAVPQMLTISGDNPSHVSQVVEQESLVIVGRVSSKFGRL